MTPPKKPNNPFDDTAQGVAYVFPKSEEINIHKSDLQIQLTKYKEKVLSSFSIFDFLAVLSLWSPIITADFKSVMGISSNEVRAGYVVLAIFISLSILVLRFKYYFKRRPPISNDPEKMADIILNQCQTAPIGKKK